MRGSSVAPTLGGEPVHPRPPTPVDEPAGGPKSDLPARLLTAAVLIPTVLYVIYLGGLYVLAAVEVLTLLGLRELYRLIEAKGAHPQVTFGLVAGGSLPVIAYLGGEYHAMLIMTASLLAMMVSQLGKARVGEALASISGTFFGIFYVGWLLSHAVLLRNFDRVLLGRWPAAAELGLSPHIGAFLLVFTLASVIACDAGAYFAGRAYGRRKLAPRISPGKTVEGAVGGVLAGVVAGVLAKLVFDSLWPGVTRAFPWSAVVPFAFTLAVVGMIGDLVESLLKRDAKRKDTGALLPGTGGVLDRIDSNLLAIPVMYYMLLGYFYLRVG